ncbi:family 20 glycosylhydrolase [Streptomyces zagrosensis]|uniref:Hexosaminidase n=1 Tax=Streptomyces zagrosensis TaxID=1042984 RepID=A0A7W9Q758_9ACTN|nr:family 20 glycosylhydrolase [Streptomyces zagrosensis]MBB5934810.1 hexosaminidase [Streptomyces zagrosensis]
MRMPRSVPKAAVIAGALVIVAALAITLAVLGWPGDDDSGPAHRSGSDSASPTGPDGQPPLDGRSPRPLGSAKAPPAPRVVPAVRSYAPEGGPGWRPGPDSRIVADPKGPLADEAKRLAHELKLSSSAGPPRRGDLALALRNEKTGNTKKDDEKGREVAAETRSRQQIRSERGKGKAPDARSAAAREVAARLAREAYVLTVRDGQALITGSDDAGVFYGTRTVRQALRSGDGRLPAGVVRDRPDRPQRGLMIDTSRKHFPASWLEARVREAADLKLNQIGLHFSDDQGFRIESSSHPEIVSDPHLTKAQVRRIVRLADQLHIAVIPEIDSPGHLGTVIRAHPSLQLRGTDGHAPRGTIDISAPGAARILDDLLREFAPLFATKSGGGPYWHLGGDEYQALTVRDPEGTFPELAERAEKKYGSGARVQDLATGWLNDRAKVARRAGARVKAWNDGFFRGGVVHADNDREVEYWTGKEIGARQPEEYLRQGRPVINANDEYLYYVLGEPNDFPYPTGRRIYEQWSPRVLRGSQPVPAELAGPERVLGGRFAIWCDISGAQTTEQVARGIRAPLRALAQRVWDPRQPSLPWAQFAALGDEVAAPR